MAVEQGANRVNERVLLVVALHQNGIKGRDRTNSELSGPLHQPGQAGKDRGCVSLGGWRLAGGEANFAGSHGEAGE